MSNNLAYGRAIAAAAGQAQGQQQNIARMLGIWSAPTHQGDDNRREEQRRGGAAYFARLQADDRQRQQDALQEQRFQNNLFLEHLRQKNSDELQQDRLNSVEKRAADSIAAANARADAARNAKPTLFDRLQSKVADEQAKVIGDRMGQMLGTTASPSDKAATAAAKSDDKRALSEYKRLQTPAGQAQTSAYIRRLGADLPSPFGEVAGMAVSDPEFAKIKENYGKAATVERHRTEDRTERADVRGDRQDAKALASGDAAISKYDSAIASSGSKAHSAAERDFAKATDPIFGDFTQKSTETPEEFDARKEAFLKDLEARQFKGLSREARLTLGMKAISVMSPERATVEWGNLLRSMRRGEIDPEDFSAMNDALIERARVRK